MKPIPIRIFHLLILVFSFSVSKAEAQREPVSWLISLDSVTRDKGVLKCQAKIQQGWHLYSQYMDEGGPMPTKFTFNEQGYKVVGRPTEKGKVTAFHDDLYDMQVVWYSDEVI